MITSEGLVLFDVSEKLRGVARRVMDNAVPVQKGEVAVFYAGTENLDIAYAFAAESESRGIETIVQSEGDYILNSKLLETPIDELEKTPRVPQALVELADWFVFMTGTRHDRSIYKIEEHQERVMEVQKKRKWTTDSLCNLCIEKETHAVFFLDPNRGQAEALGKSYQETKEMFLNSLDIDYKELSELGENIIEAMKMGGEIHMTCPNGSDLKLRFDDRVWVNDDGKLSRLGECTEFVHNLPVGEVFVPPVETSALGIIYPMEMPGSVLSGLAIEFREEENARVTAEKGFEFMEPALKNATGNPFRIAEFAFGTNPCGDPFLATEKAYGTCHVAIGGNDWLGGTNKCSIHWDFLIDSPTVTLDGNLILKDGEFRV
jgi:leucyl aminopeptidase (aminopeptidase T)